MSGEVEICNAGHCAPLLLHDGSVLPIAATGLPRGMFCQERYSSTQIKLGKGDRLLLYTDGLSEARDSGDNGDGADRLPTASASATNSRPLPWLTGCWRM